MLPFALVVDLHYMTPFISVLISYTFISLDCLADAPEWLASRYARPLSLSLPLQRRNITSDAVFNFFDNLLPDSPIVRDRIYPVRHD